ncbi:MAG: leucine-rich repeat protein [Clostridia bacterium]|nr:leucine-rich repeat protein [Clostridia bacterium]
MKKKFLFFVVIISSVICLMSISANAKTIDKTEKFTLAYAVGGQTAGAELAMWDENGNAIVWYLNADDKLVCVKTNDLIFEYKNFSIGAQTFGNVTIPAVSDVSALYEIRDGEYVLQTSRQNYSSAPHRIVAANLTEVECEYIYSTGNNKMFKAANTTSNVQCLWLPNTLKVIPGDHFHTMKNFVEVRLGESAEYIGANAFRDSSNLKTIVVPNTVKAIDTEAFRGTSLTYIIAGENLQFWGDYKGFNGPAEIYLSDTIESTLTGFPNSTLIFYTGDNPDDLTISTDKTVTKLSYSEYVEQLNDGKAFLGNWKHWYIVYGYNKCDAFYDGEHKTVEEVNDHNCTTDDSCRCGNVINEKVADAHDERIEMSYADGYDFKGTEKKYCANEDCTACDAQNELLEILTDIL